MTFAELVDDLIAYLEAIDLGTDQLTEFDRFRYYEKAIDVEDTLPDRSFSLVPQRGPVRTSNCRCKVWLDLVCRYAWVGKATAIRISTDMVLLQDALHGATGDGIQRIEIEGEPVHVPDGTTGVIDSLLTVMVEYSST